MSDPLVVSRLQKFKDDVSLQTAGNMKIMANRWLGVEDALDSHIAALAAQIADMQAHGLAVNPGKLYLMERYQKLLHEAEQQFQKYAQWAEGTVIARQTEAGLLGIEHAFETLGLMKGGVEIDKLNAAAVSTMIGFTAAGEPLGDLLTQRLVRDASGKLMPGVLERVTQTFVTGTAMGWNPNKLARAVKDDFTLGLDRAMLIARTEEMRAYRFASLAQYKKSGVVTAVKRMCAHDDRTCLACLADEGQEYSPDLGIPDHPRGRCFAIPVVTNQEPLDWEKGEQWFEGLDDNTQLAIMGPTRFAAFKQGQLDWSQMVSYTSHPIWGAGVRVKTLGELGLAKVPHDWVPPSGLTCNEDQLLKLLDDDNLGNGFTYHVDSYARPDSGYMVSTYSERELVIARKDLTPAMLKEFRLKNSDVLHDPDNFLGGWWDKQNTGMVYIDVSKLTPSLDQAVAWGREFDQLSLFQLETKQTWWIVKELPDDIKDLFPGVKNVFLEDGAAGLKNGALLAPKVNTAIDKLREFEDLRKAAPNVWSDTSTPGISMFVKAWSGKVAKGTKVSEAVLDKIIAGKAELALRKQWDDLASELQTILEGPNFTYVPKLAQYEFTPALQGAGFETQVVIGQPTRWFGNTLVWGDDYAALTSNATKRDFLAQKLWDKATDQMPDVSWQSLVAREDAAIIRAEVDKLGFGAYNLDEAVMDLVRARMGSVTEATLAGLQKEAPTLWKLADQVLTADTNKAIRGLLEQLYGRRELMQPAPARVWGVAKPPAPPKIVKAKKEPPAGPAAPKPVAPPTELENLKKLATDTPDAPAPAASVATLGKVGAVKAKSADLISGCHVTDLSNAEAKQLYEAITNAQAKLGGKDVTIHWADMTQKGSGGYYSHTYNPVNGAIMDAPQDIYVNTKPWLGAGYSKNWAPGYVKVTAQLYDDVTEGCIVHETAHYRYFAQMSQAQRHEVKMAYAQQGEQWVKDNVSAYAWQGIAGPEFEAEFFAEMMAIRFSPTWPYVSREVREIIERLVPYKPAVETFRAPESGRELAMLLTNNMTRAEVERVVHSGRSLLDELADKLEADPEIWKGVLDPRLAGTSGYYSTSPATKAYQVLLDFVQEDERLRAATQTSQLKWREYQAQKMIPQLLKQAGLSDDVVQGWEVFIESQSSNYYTQVIRMADDLKIDTSGLAKFLEKMPDPAADVAAYNNQAYYELGKAFAQRVGVVLSDTQRVELETFFQHMESAGYGASDRLKAMVKALCKLKKGEVPRYWDADPTIAELKSLFPPAAKKAVTGVGQDISQGKKLFQDLAQKYHSSDLSYVYAGSAKSSSQARIADKLRGNAAWEELVNNRFGGSSENALRDLVSAWAGTSARSKIATQIQHAAAEVFNLPEIDYVKGLYAQFDMMSDYDVVKDALKAFVKAQYDLTQEELAARGIKDLWLYRGVGRHGGTLKPPTSFAINMKEELQPLNSFSWHLSTAKGFGNNIMLTRVDASSILSCPFTGNGCLNEQEVVVLGPGFDANWVLETQDNKDMVFKYLVAILKRLT